MTLDNVASLGWFGPEIALTATILAVLLAELIFRRSDAAAVISVVGLTVAAAAIIWRPAPEGAMLLFRGMVAYDPFGQFFKTLILVATGFCVVMGMDSREIRGQERSEFFALLIATAFGGILLATAVDLIMIYLALETVSVLSYVLACYVKGSRRSAEAGLKYVIYGGVSSAVMVYGFSLLYGLAGSTALVDIREALLTQPEFAPAALLAIMLALAGFGYKIASVPFHMWSPDVYQGAPAPVTAFFSVVPKAAGFAALIRFFLLGFAQVAPPGAEGWRIIEDVDWVPLLMGVSVFTMTVGNLAAIPQDSVKRMLAYSSIAHAGYLLMGFVLLTERGLEAIFFYLVAYVFMNLGIFLVVILMTNQLQDDDLSAYRGLFRRGGQAAFVASTAVVFLFALTGLPPTAGFMGKWYLFYALLESDVWWLALVGVVNTVVSLYYYARILRAMFMDDPAEGADQVLEFNPVHLGLLLVLAGLTLWFGMFPDSLMLESQRMVELYMGDPTILLGVR